MGKKAAILGFGTVGQGIYEGILNSQENIEKSLGESVEVTAILVQDPSKPRNVSEDILITNNIEEILAIPDLEIVFEAIVGIEPCFSYLKKCIEKGCHVITANKAMFAQCGQELEALAAVNKVRVKYEATVAGGVPIIGALSSLLTANQIYEMQGILNGTSNYILTSMRTKGISFHEALQDAQQLGYAEADPTSDIEGFDAFYKLIILMRTSLRFTPDWDQVSREGITSITDDYIKIAEKYGLRFKHIAFFSNYPNQARTYWVAPVVVNQDHPFYAIDGVDNTIHIKGSLVGGLTFTGPGAGKLPTASAMIEDMLQIYSEKQKLPVSEVNKNEPVADEQVQKQWIIFGNEYIVGRLNQQIVKDVIHDEEICLIHAVADHHTIRQIKEEFSIRAYEYIGDNHPFTASSFGKERILQEV